METPEERFIWSSKLIEAVLELRFKNAAIRSAIDNAKGNSAKREAWTNLAKQFHDQQRVDIPEAKLRRVISKWQSQHRAWAASPRDPSSLSANGEHHPTYMSVLQRYFEAPRVAPKQAIASPVEERVVGLKVRRETQPVSPNDAIRWMESRDEESDDSVGHQVIRAGFSKQRNMDSSSYPQAPSYMAMVDDDFAVQRNNAFRGDSSMTKKQSTAGVTHQLLQVHQEQLALQQRHVEQQLSLQRKQQAELHEVQRRQLESLHAVLKALGDPCVQV